MKSQFVMGVSLVPMTAAEMMDCSLLRIDLFLLIHARLDPENNLLEDVKYYLVRKSHFRFYCYIV